MAKNFSRRKFLSALGVSALAPEISLSKIGSEKHSEPGRPNVIFIMTDQHRQDGVGIYPGSKAITPNLDQLAQEGILFNRAYVAQPVCAPNRASMLSGLYPHSHGVLENTWSLSSRVTTTAEILGTAGYMCGYFGKWHLDRVNSHGFSIFPDYPGDGRGDDHYFIQDGEKRYSVDVITDDVIEFIRANKNKPFYSFVSYYPPHPAYAVPEQWEQLYADIYPADEKRRIYYGMCSKVDEQIGRILQEIRNSGIEENTLVLFTSDHGHYFDKRWNNHPKRLCFDISARVPLIMRFPGKIAVGQVTDGLFSSVDLNQTIIGLTGLSQFEGLQGVDQSDFITGKEESPRDALVIENFPYPDKTETPGPYKNEPLWSAGEERCIFDGEWKLILSTTRPPELYNLVSDSNEVINQWSAKKDMTLVKILGEKLHIWGVETGDDLAPTLAGQYCG